MECVASTLHTTTEHGVSSITTADAHTSADSSRLNWRPRRFKWTRPFRWKTKSDLCACAITFQLACTIMHCTKELSATQLPVLSALTSLCLSPPPPPSPNVTPSPFTSFCSNSLPQSVQPFYLSCVALAHSQFADKWDTEICRRTCIGAGEFCYGLSYTTLYIVRSPFHDRP